MCLSKLQKIGAKLREICDLIIAHVEIQQRIQSYGKERQNSKAAQDLVQVRQVLKHLSIYKNFTDPM